MRFNTLILQRRRFTSWKQSALVDWSRLQVQNIDENDLMLDENIISEAEEKQLVEECQARLRRRRYEHNHWDDVIIGFKEMETMSWSSGTCCIYPLKM